MAIAPTVFIPLMLFAGFLLNEDNIPVWLIWVKYLSLFKWGFQILAINEFEGLTFECNADEITDNGDCPIPDGEKVLRNLDLDDYTIWQGFLGLCALFAAARFMGLVGLWLTAGRKKA